MHKGVGQQQTTTNQQKTAQYNKTQTEMTCKTCTQAICPRRKREVLGLCLSIYRRRAEPGTVIAVNALPLVSIVRAVLVQLGSDEDGVVRQVVQPKR